MHRASFGPRAACGLAVGIVAAIVIAGDLPLLATRARFALLIGLQLVGVDWLLN